MWYWNFQLDTAPFSFSVSMNVWSSMWLRTDTRLAEKNESVNNGPYIIFLFIYLYVKTE